MHLVGRGNTLTRLLIRIAGFNLSLMRQSLGAGTPRGLAALIKALRALFEALLPPFRIPMLRPWTLTGLQS